MAKKFKKKRAKRFVMPDVTLTPLVDTALTLLVIFMIAAPVIKKGVNVTFPSKNDEQPIASKTTVVDINKNGKYVLNSFPHEKKEVFDSLKKAVAQQSPLPVELRFPRDVAYATVLDTAAEFDDEIDGLEIEFSLKS